MRLHLLELIKAGNISALGTEGLRGGEADKGSQRGGQRASVEKSGLQWLPLLWLFISTGPCYLYELLAPGRCG